MHVSVGVLRRPVVPGRLLVLLPVYALHAHHLRVHAGAAAAPQHAGNTQDGQQALQHTGYFHYARTANKVCNNSLHEATCIVFKTDQCFWITFWDLFFFRANCTFHISTLLSLTFFPCVFVLFHSCFSHVQVFG